jgi:prophage regulatory protein
VKENEGSIDVLLRLSDVKEQTKLGSSTIYRRIKAGTFPRPRELGENCVRWRQSEVQAWIETLPAAGVSAG